MSVVSQDNRAWRAVPMSSDATHQYVWVMYMGATLQHVDTNVTDT